MSAESSKKFSGPVLHLATERTWRGGEAQLLTLALGLAARGIRQLVVCPPGSELESRAKAAGLATQGLVMRGEWDLMAPRRLRKIAEEFSPAVCHAHTAHAHAILLRAFPKKQAGPHLVISRRVDFAVGRGLLSRRKYARSDLHFLAISRGVRDAL
ncbi:MAG: glycosyltransferase, partial [bacterium]